MKIKSKADIIKFIIDDDEMMKTLRIISKLDLPDYYIGGGWLRN